MITWIDLFTFIIMLCAVITLVRNDKHKKGERIMSKMVRTLSEEAKDIIRNYVEMGREYDRKELVAEIKEKAERKEEMTDGVIAGAIKMLTASNEIMVAARGRYRKGSPVGNQNMQEKVVALFQKFKGDLDKICMVNALNLKEDDFRFITL